ncbi:LysR family transcriptional regulator, partial [Klebsiella quasipneumoniae]
YRQLAVVMRQDKVITKGMAEMLRLLQAVRL